MIRRRGLRRPGMSPLQTVLLIGAAFVVVWGLMAVWQGVKTPLQERTDETLRGVPGNPAGGVPASSNEPGITPPPSSEGAQPPVDQPPATGDTRSGWTKFLDRMQTTLDIAGLAPGVGEPADVLNAIISASRGNWVDAGLSATSAIPFLGWGGTTAKFIKKVPAEELITHADEARDALKAATQAKDVKKAEESLGNLAAVEKEYVDRVAEGINVPPTKLPRGVSQALYDELRKKTPTPAIRDMVNEGKKFPFPDPVLPGLTITGRLHADHIVSMDAVTRLPGFEKLNKEQMLAVLNNPINFIGLSEAANKSKGAKSFAEWIRHKSRGIDVDEAFRARMIQEEARLRQVLQGQINSYLR